MQCLYCDRHLGYFHKGKSAFCCEQHEELYRSAAQRRLETPYALSAGALENSAVKADAETAQSEDLAQLLKATQANSGASVETPAQAGIAADSAEAVMASVTNSVAAATNVRAVPEMAHGGPPTHVERPTGRAASWSDEAPPLPNATVSPLPEPSSATVSAPIGEDTDRRSEPRVKDIKIVKVAALRHPEREMTCALVDTSDTGIQFTSDADFPVGEVLIAELPDQIVLTEVRYSQAKGGRYAIGAERVQSVSKDVTSQASSGMERAEFLIKALCDRVRTGFADETGHRTDAAGCDQRQYALERVARILEIWQGTKSDRNPKAEPPAPASEPLPDSVQETHAEARHSNGAGRAFAAVTSCLVLSGLLTLCVVQFRNRHAVTATPKAALPSRAREGVVNTEAKQAPEVAQQVKPQPAAASPVQVAAPVDADAPGPPKAKPITPQLAPAAAGLHRAQIKAIESTWVGVSSDGKKIFGGMITKGSTKDLEYSKFAFLHAGNAAGVEITVDGQPVPMGNQPRLRLVELNTTGYRFLRWSNDDPPQP